MAVVMMLPLNSLLPLPGDFKLTNELDCKCHTKCCVILSLLEWIMSAILIIHNCLQALACSIFLFANWQVQFILRFAENMLGNTAVSAKMTCINEAELKQAFFWLFFLQIFACSLQLSKHLRVGQKL